MSDGPPALVAIDCDDCHAKHVGHTAGGRQFFLTTPFEPVVGEREGAEFIALYLFDASGKLMEAKIDELGAPRHPRRDEGARAVRPPASGARRGQV